jgi:hypothetical protein
VQLEREERCKEHSLQIDQTRYIHRLKGIVSRDFGTPFFISLDRFEGRDRAGSGLFFILMTFSCLNFKKLS